MDEMDLYRAIDNCVKLKKQNQVANLVEISLAAAAARGNKEANRKLKKIVKEASQEDAAEQTRELIKTGQGKLASGQMLTPEQLKKLTKR